MCLRIILYSFLTFMFIVHRNFYVDGKLLRSTRTDSSESEDSSKSFSDAFQAFLSNLFGSNYNKTEVDDESMHESLVESTPGYEMNVSQITSTLNENSTNVMSELNQPSNSSMTNYSHSSANTTVVPEAVSSSTEVVSSAWDIMPTTQSKAENSKCYYDTHLKYYCVLPNGMSDMSFRDLYSLFFSDLVIDTLKTSCPRGSWCLQDTGGNFDSLIFEMVDSVTELLLSTNICTQEFQSCVVNMANKFIDCAIYPRMQITIEAMQLVCGLIQNRNLSSDCFKEVLITLHVTLSDVLRREDNLDKEMTRCQSPEAYMTKRLICVEVACPKESKRFHSFSPWSWFTSVEDDFMIECKLNPSDCEVSQSGTSASGNDIKTTGNKVTSTTTEIASTSSTSEYPMSTTWFESSTSYPPEDEKCYTDAVFQNFCPVPEDMTDVSFWDLYSVFFSDSVLDALMIGCTKGTWCLKDKFDYWQSLIVERVDMVMHSEISDSMCNPKLETCINTVVNSFKNCSMYQQMVYTSEVLKLVCGLKQNPNLDSPCYMHVISALHVTLADILREKENDEVSEDTCDSPEAHMTKGLICVENSCPGESGTFHSFKPWAWFTSVVDDLIDECNYDSTKCLALLQRPDSYTGEMGTLVGISVATMVTALTLTVVVCTCYKRHRRNAVVKEGYQRLLTDGDES